MIQDNLPEGSNSISDQEILEMVQRHTLVWQDGHVFKYHRSRRKYTRLKMHMSDAKDRYEYRIRTGGTPPNGKGYKQRTINAARLVWLITNFQEIPAGYVVDHKDHDPFNDRPSNLQLREKSDNESDNQRDSDPTAYLRGQTDFKNGVPPSHNPYRVKSSQFYAWEKGFHDSAVEDF